MIWFKAGGISSKLDRALSANLPLALVRVEALEQET